MGLFLSKRGQFIIFGWGRRHIKNIGSTIIQKCSICSHKSYFSLVRSREWFTLFFIPIFPYETKYYLECPVCRNGFEIEDNENIKKLKDIVGLMGKFDSKEITKKELINRYEELVKGLKKENKKEERVVISKKDIKKAEKKDNKDFLLMLKVVGIVLGLAALYFIIRWIFFKA